MSALQNCFSGLEKAAKRSSQEPDCPAARVAHATWASSWLCVLERAEELIAVERFPQQVSHVEVFGPSQYKTFARAILSWEIEYHACGI